MNLSRSLVVALLALSAAADVRRPPSGSSLQTDTEVAAPAGNEEVIGDGIRHRKRKRIRTQGVGRNFRRRNKQRNTATRRYLEKQLLVYNRTIELLGDEVDKILHGSEEAWRAERLDRDRNDVATPWESSPPDVQGKGGSLSLSSSGTGEVKDVLKSGLEKALSRLLLQFLATSSSPHHPPTPHQQSPCRQWQDCKKRLEDVFLGPLPSCPCRYPSGIFYENRMWDEIHQRYFHWRDASGEGERLDVYKPGAVYCIRSLLAHHSTTLSAQHCCYDKERKLITRGSGAGNPNYVSPDASSTLHYKIDILPWRICKGDFTRYNKVRPPNNGNRCKVNPDDEEFKKQVDRATNF